MPNENRISGIMSVKVDGVSLDIFGDWTLNLGRDKNEALVGLNGPHGYKSMKQVPFAEGETRNTNKLDIEALLGITNATVTFELANGKTYVYSEAWYAGDGDFGTEEGNVQVRFEAMRAEEV